MGVVPFEYLIQKMVSPRKGRKIPWWNYTKSIAFLEVGVVSFNTSDYNECIEHKKTQGRKFCPCQFAGGNFETGSGNRKRKSCSV